MKRDIGPWLDEDKLINEYSGGELARILIQRLTNSNALIFISLDLRLALIRKLSKNVPYEP